MIDYYTEYVDIVKKVMTSNGMVLVGNDVLGNDNQFYFRDGDNPLEINGNFVVVFDASSTTPERCTFHFASTTGVSCIIDPMFDSKEETGSIVIYDGKGENLDLETFKKEVETDYITIQELNSSGTAVYICDKILNVTEREKIIRNYQYFIDSPIELEVLFRYANMYKEYIDWIITSDVDELLPSAAKDVFLF